jgi:hypothetical protein
VCFEYHKVSKQNNPAQILIAKQMHTNALARNGNETTLQRCFDILTHPGGEPLKKRLLVNVINKNNYSL